MRGKKYIQVQENPPKVLSILNYQQYEYDLLNNRLDRNPLYFTDRIVKKEVDKNSLAAKLNYKLINIKKL